MSTLNFQPQSLFDIWSLYQLETQKSQSKDKASARLSLVKTALIRYTLPGWGFTETTQQRVTAWESYLGIKFMEQVSLAQFSQACEVQKLIFEQQEIPTTTRRTYQTALNHLLKWCETQAWWEPYRIQQHNFSPQNTSEQISPTPRSRYGLGSVKGDILPANLERELELFREFRIQQAGVKQSTAEHNLRQVRLVLGWLHRVKGVSLDEISLTKIVPFADLDLPAPTGESTPAEVAAFASLDLARQYISWLKEDSLEESSKSRSHKKSSYTSADVLGIFLNVARFVYRDRSRPQNLAGIGKAYQDVPVMQLLRHELSQVQLEAKRLRSTEGSPEQIPEWSELLEIVEKLRQHCSISENRIRSIKNEDAPIARQILTVAANRYQYFLLAALSSYLPPQRQQVYRNLQFSNSSINKGKDPSSQNPEVSGNIYQEDGKWYIHLYADDYKTSKTYEDLLVKIPNIQYLDNRCFYQYLEEWLLEYKCPAEAEIVKTFTGLRQVYNPQHDYFFTQRNGKRYTHATSFKKLLQFSSSETLGKPFTHELVKKMFANHIFRHASTRDRIEALLSSMGHHLDISKPYDIWSDQRTVQLGSEFAQREAQDFVNQRL
jgi:hypothetical protein